MLMRMDPLLKLLSKHDWLQDEGDNKEGWTIFKKSHIIRIGFIIFTPAHDLNNWTLLCLGETMWPEH